MQIQAGRRKGAEHPSQGQQVERWRTHRFSGRDRHFQFGGFACGCPPGRRLVPSLPLVTAHAIRQLPYVLRPSPQEQRRRDSGKRPDDYRLHHGCQAPAAHAHQ